MGSETYIMLFWRSIVLLIVLLFCGFHSLKKKFIHRRHDGTGRFSSYQSSLPSVDDIQYCLDKMNEEREIQPFFGNTFHAEDKDRGLFGILLADKVNCDRQYIFDTGIIAGGTLLLPYNGVNIDGIVEDIIAASKISPSAPRSKYLMATLRGVGGGKTRMIEEARIRMGLLYPNWLPIAITFNHKTHKTPNDYVLKNPQAIVAYAVCCRMMAAVYNTPIIDAQACLNTALNITESTNYAPNMLSFAENLIVGTVRHIAGRVQKVNPSIDSMVLFIDEPVKLIEKQKFFDVDNDIYWHLRQTILGESVGKVFNTSLVMASLNVSVFGITDSDRIIKPILLASKLCVDHIVDKMWIPFFHASSPLLDATERSILKWLAASVSAAPRLVEIMGIALQDKFADTWSGGRRGLTLRQSMGAVLSAFVQLQAHWYQSVPFPVGKYLHALINDQAIDVDATMLQYVRSSTFTNSIPLFPHNEIAKPVLVPESALCLLASATDVVSDDNIVKEIQKDFKAIWGNLVDHITSPESSPLGQPLEDVFPRVLRMKILSSHLKEGSSGHTTLMYLLAIKDISLIKYTIGGAPYKAAKISKTGKSVMQDGVKKTIKQWEADTFEHFDKGDKSAAKRDILKELLLRKIIVPTSIDITSLASSSNMFAWKEAIRSINYELVLKFPLPNNDHCDSMMFFRMLASGTTSPTLQVGPDEIVLVFEEKSKGEKNQKNEIWWGHFTQGKAGEKEKGPYDQHCKFCKAVASITESDLEGDKGGYLRALKEGRFIYVYVTTHGGPTVYLTAQDLPDIKCDSLGVLILSREVTKRILGPIFDVYALTRSAMEKGLHLRSSSSSSSSSGSRR